jgi:hypothetical protein
MAMTSVLTDAQRAHLHTTMAHEMVREIVLNGGKPMFGGDYVLMSINGNAVDSIILSSPKEDIIQGDYLGYCVSVMGSDPLTESEQVMLNDLTDDRTEFFSGFFEWYFANYSQYTTSNFSAAALALNSILKRNKDIDLPVQKNLQIESGVECVVPYREVHLNFHLIKNRQPMRPIDQKVLRIKIPYAAFVLYAKTKGYEQAA